MPFISTGGRAAGRPRRRAGALLAAVAVAAGRPRRPRRRRPPAAAGTPYVYVANSGSDTVTAYDAATGTVTATIPVGNHPIARGGQPGRHAPPTSPITAAVTSR